MKKMLLLVLAIAVPFLMNAQNQDKLWSIGIEGGGQQYNGVHGDNFYKPSNGLYGMGGLSVYRYMSPHFDIGIQATGGGIGYKVNSVDLYKTNLYQMNFNVRFSFFKYENVRLRPFILLGFGDAYLSGGDLQGKKAVNNFSVPDNVGVGVNYRLSNSFNLKLQETFLMPLTTFNLKSQPDAYLLHTLGISWNIGRKKDADKDGVSDKNDQCPNTPMNVKVDKKGCPLDTDGDGIADYLDACPDVKGVASAKGCPDADGDGVADMKDKCPNTPAGLAVDTVGCPLDRDGDGIPDYQDACPDVKGTIAMHGCPDSDNDGVSDNNDKCPNTPVGVKVDASGCPLDRDGDGVPDYMDACPDVKGIASNKGCPEVKQEEKEIFRKALEGIEFQTGKDVIQKKSFPILEQVVNVMKNNPSYNLQMNGYTDNKGKPEANRILSEKRAMAVKKYLEDHGIPAGQLKAKGFGEENPRAENNTEAGRKKNRRVEFIVTFEK